MAIVLCSQKTGKGTKLQFLGIRGTLQGGRVEDHRLIFTIQLHSPQLYIQAILYIYKSDYMMSLTLNTLSSVCIFSLLFSIHFLMCWQGEFVQQSRGSSFDYHFLHSHDLNALFRDAIERRN